MKKYFTFWTILSIIGICLLFVVLQWNSFNAPFERDEGHYAYGAWLLTQGHVPYVDTFEQKPPLIFFPYLLAVLINSAAFWPVHLIAFISFALTVGLLGLTVTREFGQRAGLIAMWLITPMVMLPYLTPFAANTEKFMILPLMGLLAIYVFNRDKPGNWPWFFAAVCGAATILYKQIAIFAVLFIFLVWLVENWRREKSVGSLLPRILFALAGAVLTFVLVTGYFFARGGWPGFWEQTVEFNRYYMAASGGLTFNFLFNHLKIFLYYWQALFFLLIWFLIKRPLRWGFYLGLLLISLASIFNTPYGHYYIMLMPFWAIVSAVALDSLIDQIAIRFKPAMKGWVTFALVFLVLLSMLWPVRSWYFMTPTEVTSRSYSLLNPFVEAPIVAQRVADLTKPDDYVFVAGTEQEILYYAKRLGPTRFGGMYGLMIEHPKALAYQQELVAELGKHPPKVIVWVRSPLSWLVRRSSPRLIFQYLDKLLKERYELVGGSIRRGDSAYWQEPLKKETYGSCSIKVYKLKARYFSPTKNP
ncbi:MAG: glycosyltransferase family 39 protein [Candidatus Margulisbacteria bacterium]|nr:glycosyltransferase family 39 protein [Candidatus Margulisiibacteriota bacterium]